MKKIKTKLMIGIGIVFLISYIIMMVNIGTNQSIVDKSESLLTSNYASLKHTFQMLKLLNDINVDIAHGLSEDEVAGQTFQIIKRLEAFKDPLEHQVGNITEPGELQLTNDLRKSFNAFRDYLITREQPFYWNEYNRLFMEVREDILEIYQMNADTLEAKNDEIKEHAENILSLQKNVGIIGLALLCILVIFLPLYLIRPVNHLTNKLKGIYEKKLNKKVTLKKGHEIQQLEEMVEKMASEFNDQKIS
ncbi:MAG: hypothetical protein ACP5D9_19600 [Mariniphaga sp.]